MILVGLALVAVEVYLVPGFNVVGIVGLLGILFGIGYAFSANGMIGGTLALIGSVGIGSGMGYLMWRSGAWEQFVLSTSVPPDQILLDKAQENRSKYLGKTGKALTPLRPTGVAEVDGERIEVVTEGAFISAGSKIRVVAMDRRRVFVRLDHTTGEFEAVAME
jgi:membrane-bound serine protease (ClpP class)